MNRTLAPVLAAMAMVATATGIAHAHPSFNSACIGCHNDGSGSLTLNPTLIKIPIGGSDLISFDVTALPAPSGDNMIALTDLLQAGLDASNGVGGDNWSLATFTKSDVGIGTGPYTLDLEIGPAAVLGTYDLTWYLPGGEGEGPVGTSGMFSIQIIPEPTTLALFGSGAAALGIVTRRRRYRRRE